MILISYTRAYAYQRPEEVGELERVLEQDEVDEDEQNPGVVEPEEVIGGVDGDVPGLHGGMLRGHLVCHLGYDVLQLRPNQKQQLHTEQAGHTHHI
jgi:hypothetical protein